MLDGTGRVLGVRNLGEGPPLLLLNGYSGTAADWDPTFLATLAGAHTVVAPDHQGMGRSSAGDLDQLTIDSMADDVAVVLDGLGIDRVPVVGWSMGGMVAQAFAADGSATAHMASGQKVTAYGVADESVPSRLDARFVHVDPPSGSGCGGGPGDGADGTGGGVPCPDHDGPD